MQYYQIIDSISQLIEEFDRFYPNTNILQYAEEKEKAIANLKIIKECFLTAFENVKAHNVQYQGDSQAYDEIPVDQDPLQNLFVGVRKSASELAKVGELQNQHVRDDLFILRDAELHIGMLFFTDHVRSHRIGAIISLLQEEEKEELIELLRKPICNVDIDKLYSNMLSIEKRLAPLTDTDIHLRYRYNQFCIILFSVGFLSLLNQSQSAASLDVDGVYRIVESFLHLNIDKAIFFEEKISSILGHVMILQQEENHRNFEPSEVFTKELFNKIHEIMPLLPFKDRFREKLGYRDIIKSTKQLLEADEILKCKEAMQCFVDQLSELNERCFNRSYNHITDYIGRVLSILYHLKFQKIPRKYNKEIHLQNISDDLARIDELLKGARNTPDKMRLKACYEEIHQLFNRQIYQFWNTEQHLQEETRVLTDIIQDELSTFKEDLNVSMLSLCEEQVLTDREAGNDIDVLRASLRSQLPAEGIGLFGSGEEETLSGEEEILFGEEETSINEQEAHGTSGLGCGQG